MYSLTPTLKQQLKMGGVVLMIFLGGTQLAQAECFDLPKTTPSSRFTPIGDGSKIKDTKTNIIWQRCAIGQTWDNTSQNCVGNATVFNSWQTALQSVASMGKNTYLPNVKQLMSLVEHACHGPAINESVFKGFDKQDDATWYWSSTPDMADDNNVYALNSHSGTIRSVGKNSTGVVRAVVFE